MAGDDELRFLFSTSLVSKAACLLTEPEETRQF
jgi:hypothetical protein